MRLSRRVALGGRQLDELHRRIVIRSVVPGTPVQTVEDTDRMGGFGKRITREHWDTLETQVVWAMDIPKTNLQERRDVYELVTAWAMRKGWLTVSYMDNRRMYVDQVILPQGGDLWAWADDFTIVFRAVNVPFWQEITANSKTVASITSGTTVVPVNGVVPCPLNVTFQNISGQACTNFTITAGGKTMSFPGINLGGSSELVISHTNSGLLKVTANGADAYGKMQGVDDLIVSPGDVNVSISATRAGKLTVSSFGRYV